MERKKLKGPNRQPKQPQKAASALPQGPAGLEEADLLPRQLSPAWRNLYRAVAEEIKQINWQQSDNNRSN